MWWCKVHYFQGISVEEFIARAEEHSRRKTPKKNRLPTIWEVKEGPPPMPAAEYSPRKTFKERLPIIWEAGYERSMAVEWKRSRMVYLPTIKEVCEFPEFLTEISKSATERVRLLTINNEELVSASPAIPSN